ncbi:hypothetical protein EPO04_03835 [Patescibacteria group bacterium]|nr:MAG: hypothetical protein EPO04_03835 [Patescibacteria group bacterium]
MINQQITIADLNPKKLLPLALRYKTLLTTLVVVALFGFTAYQISQITSVEPDPVYLQAKEKEAKTAGLKINKQTLDQVTKLDSSAGSTTPVNVGKSNPFSF